MGKSRRPKDSRVLVSKTRSYSAYNATNYLISTGDTAAEDPSKTSADKDESDQDYGAGPAVARSPSEDSIDKYALYQRAVQKPKGDISYLRKFFLNYIGGRTPLYLREDFCGTAFICAEWVRGDTRRTAVGLDLDEEALTWGLQHNVANTGSDACSRVHLFCGDVVNPLSEAWKINADFSTFPDRTTIFIADEEEDHKGNEGWGENVGEDVQRSDLEQPLPLADIICAFNYSCCCLRRRADLVQYFSQALKAMSVDGGIFAMDLYGGMSSQCPLKLRRRFDDFQYTWEQEDYDVITHTTRISLHFRLNKNQGVLRHAFSYHWRLWTLPEVKECLEEAGFRSVHFWIRNMPDIQGQHSDGVADNESEFEEMDNFLQQDAWNAYVVAVAAPRSTGRRDL